MTKVLRYVALLLAAVLVFSAARFLDSGPRKRTADKETAEPSASALQTEWEQAQEETEGREQRFVLTFGGDCTFGNRLSHTFTSFSYEKVVGEDYGYPFANLKTFFEEDDLTLLNLEGVLCEDGEVTVGENAFRGPSRYSRLLSENGVELVSLANDHTMDCGQKGYDATKAALDSQGVSYLEADKTTVLTLEGGLTVGIYANAYTEADTAAVTAVVQALAEQAELVIFAPHWGVQRSRQLSQAQLDMGYAAIDAGADIVCGCHPGVLQPVEYYNGGVIFYSLGSLSYGGNIYPDDYDSALVQQEVLLAADGTVTLGQTTAVPLRISSKTDVNNYQPVLYGEDTDDYRRVLEKLNLSGVE